MTGEVEAAGALATAGAVAGAIEPGDPGKPGEGGCLNCGAELGGGRYCGNCGQSARPHRTLGGLLGEFLASLWNFDTKAWRTLPLLLFRPGTLTRAYVYGKRARYISPLTAFLLSIFLMFFAFSTVQIPQNTRDNASEIAATAEDLAEARQELAQAQTELQRARTNPDPDEPAGLEEGLAEGAVRIAEGQVQRIERQLARQQERQAAAQAAQAENAAQSAETPAGEEQPSAQTADSANETDEGGVRISVNGQPVSEDSTWQEELRDAVDRGEVDVNMGHPALNARALETLRNPDLALSRIQEAASKFSFLLAPMSLPFIALLFLWKRGVTLYDHMAYALYALAFAALLFSSVVLIGKVPFVSWAAGWLLLSLPVHMYFHLGGAYALGWFSALWRTIFMLFFSLIVACIFFTMVIILGLVG
ncbi:MAG TPA: DUF3667 domain-containing protein [Vitreimonas sp.]|nr:DUF3667 domain-containing protein [Vitreimonas sp.]